jgi:hypothetical protein
MNTPRNQPAPFTPPASATPPVSIPDVSVSPVASDLSRSSDAPFVKAKFEGLVLVCGQCEKRGSGPSKLTAKDARKALKRGLGGQGKRMRVVQSSCLGLCPKKSIAIAAAAEGTPSLLAEVRNERDLKTVAARLGSPRKSP